MQILSKKILSDVSGIRVIRIDIRAPQIALKAQPGQFVVVMVKEEGERIPLTVVGAEKDYITLIFQEAGLSTKLLGQLREGDSVYAIVGPLGHATHIKNYGKVILVAGGVGIAEIYPVAKAMKDAGNKVTTIIGARAKDLLMLEEELKAASDELLIATDDGSYGKKGFTTDILKERLSAPPRQGTAVAGPAQAGKYGLIYVVGPIPMMKKAAAVTKDSGVKTIASLNATMLDASGMCGGCRVTVGGEVKFACVDGPEFDAHLVDWDELAKRTKTYTDKESHICRLNKL